MLTYINLCKTPIMDPHIIMLIILTRIIIRGWTESRKNPEYS